MQRAFFWCVFLAKFSFFFLGGKGVGMYESAVHLLINSENVNFFFFGIIDSYVFL